MTSRRLMVRWCMLLLMMAVCVAQVDAVGAAGAADKGAQQTTPAGSQAAAAEKDRKFVADTLAKIDPDDPATVAVAQRALVERGGAIVPALEDALAHATGPARAAVDGALVSLVWKIDPPKLIKDWVLKQNKDFQGEVAPTLISDAALQRELPNCRFYLVAFPQYPVAMMPPAPLAARNIFTVAKDGTVDRVAGVKGLKKLFADRLPPVKAESDAADAVNAWLVVSKEFTSDGMMRFTILRDRIRVVRTDKGWEAGGAATLGGTGGHGVVALTSDRGSINVTITFDDKGRFRDAVEEVMVQAGIRPICQATKLLDADPVVRKMARQDLLIMGAAAREYIMSQREKASPELRAEIDRVWREILDREREWQSWSKGK